METIYEIKSFKELSTKDLYEILKLRNEVFIVEQECAYLDLDGKDEQSYHLMCFVNGNLAGYTRLLPQGISYGEAAIGRVVIGKDYRGLKLGRKLMEKSIQACENLFGTKIIRIGAQVYLTDFYRSLGFSESGQPYDEDGIAHVEMLRR
ncbi:putative acyltransferase [compost metagenome]